jgi:hypothetical protein
VTGRPPTFGDFSPEGKKLAEKKFSDIISNPSSMATAAAASARGRAAGGGDPDYVKKETRRAEQMDTIAELTTDVKRPKTMNTAATRIADNYGRAQERTQRGDVGLTNAPLGFSSSTSTDFSTQAAIAAGKGTAPVVGGPWYFHHGDDITKIARSQDADVKQSVVAGGMMSPQNSPSNEKAATRAMIRGEAQDLPVTLRAEVNTEGMTAKQAAKTKKAHADAPAALGMEHGETKNFTQFTPEQIAKIPSHRDALDTPVDVMDLAKYGTEGPSGVRAIRGESTQEDLGDTGKVPSYVHQTLLAAGIDSMGEKGADANDIAEFHRRVHESDPNNKPYFEQPTLFGEQWEADPWGRGHVTTGVLNIGKQPDVAPEASESAKTMYPGSHNRHMDYMMKDQGVTDPKDVVLPEATTAQDTWQMAQQLALPRSVEGKNASGNVRNPALVGKMLGSDPLVMNVGGGDQYMPTAKGERKLAPSEAMHAMSNEVNNRAAAIVTERARAAGRNVGAGVPAVAVQAGSWTGYRIDMEKALEYGKSWRPKVAKPPKPPNARKSQATK